MAAAALTLMMTMTVLTACTSDNDDNPVAGVDGRIVGKWYSDVSGKTFAKWNYGETWQSTEFKADGTGSTLFYFRFMRDGSFLDGYWQKMQATNEYASWCGYAFLMACWTTSMPVA